MKTIYLKAENGRLIETSSNEGLPFEWDGVYWSYYGESKMYTHEGVTYDCFPIIYIGDERDKIETIQLFGCVGKDRCDDKIIWELPIDTDLWPEVKPFMNI